MATLSDQVTEGRTPELFPENAWIPSRDLNRLKPSWLSPGQILVIKRPQTSQSRNTQFFHHRVLYIGNVSGQHTIIHAVDSSQNGTCCSFNSTKKQKTSSKGLTAQLEDLLKVAEKCPVAPLGLRVTDLNTNSDVDLSIKLREAAEKLNKQPIFVRTTVFPCADFLTSFVEQTGCVLVEEENLPQARGSVFDVEWGADEDGVNGGFSTQTEKAAVGILGTLAAGLVAVIAVGIRIVLKR